MDFLASENDGWPFVEEIKHQRRTVTDIYEWIAEVDVSDDPPTKGDLKLAFRMMVDAAIAAKEARGWGSNLSEAEKIVAGWPDWKKRVLGYWKDERE